ncbi:MAG: ComEC/Rec2 family competence protein [Bryobacteraceae bacterium]
MSRKPCRRDPLLVVFIAVAAGIAASRFLQFERAPSLAAWAALSLLALAARRWASPRAVRWASIAALAFTGALVENVWRPGPPPRIEFDPGETMILAGCVVEPPALSEDREQFVIELDPGARVRVTWYVREGDTPPALHYGQNIELEARLRKPRNYGNPGAFDFVRFLARGHIHWLASANSHSKLHVASAPCGSPLLRVVYGWRENAVARADRLFGSDPFALGMARAVLLGDTARLDPEWAEDFRSTGSYHALVISGLHLTTLTVCFVAILRLAGLGPGWTLLFTSTAAWLYALLTGAGAPVVRASAGLTLYWLGRWFYRTPRVMNLLAAVALAFILADPDQLFDTSFQFSFSAVALIGGIAVPWIERTTHPYAAGCRRLAKRAWDPLLPPRVAAVRVEARLIAETMYWTLRLPEKAAFALMQIAARAVFFVTDLLMVSAVVQLGLALPMVFYFHRASVTGLGANLLIVPTMAILVPVGFVAVFTGWAPAAWLTARLLTLNRETARWFAALEPAARVPDPPLWLAILLAGAVVLVILGFRRSGRTAAFAAALFTPAFAALILHPFSPGLDSRWLELTAIDVGQGDSLLMVAPDGSVMLVDAGGFPVFGARRGKPPSLDIGEDVVTPYLLSRSIRKLDVLVATHAHEDHIGGLIAVARNFSPREVWIGGEDNAGDSPWPAIRRQLERMGVAVVSRRAGERFLWGGARIDILSPPPGHQPGRNRNNDSLTFRVDYGDRSFLLTGDVEKQMEYRMVEDGRIRPVDVLKVAHHGSKTSTTAEFLDAARPRWALISDGAANQFGHPHPSVVQRLGDAGVRLLRTDRNGLIRIRTNGRRWEIDRYWESADSGK